MKKIFILFALMCASMTGFAIDWSSYDWLGDGAGGGAYTEKYKLAAAEGQTAVNIQQPGFAAEAGIYSYFPVALSSCSLQANECVLEGGGIVMYLSAFTAKETEVVVTDANGTEYVCYVYFVDGTDEPRGIENTALQNKAQKVIENGMMYIEKNGIRFNVLGGQVR